jgi:hypothetical protein
MYDDDNRLLFRNFVIKHLGSILVQLQVEDMIPIHFLDNYQHQQVADMIANGSAFKKVTRSLHDAKESINQSIKVYSQP